MSDVWNLFPDASYSSCVGSRVLKPDMVTQTGDKFVWIYQIREVCPRRGGRRILMIQELFIFITQSIEIEIECPSKRRDLTIFIVRYWLWRAHKGAGTFPITFINNLLGEYVEKIIPCVIWHLQSHLSEIYLWRHTNYDLKRDAVGRNCQDAMFGLWKKCRATLEGLT
jgi:hypothetical protein